MCVSVARVLRRPAVSARAHRDTTVRAWIGFTLASPAITLVRGRLWTTQRGFSTPRYKGSLVHADVAAAAARLAAGRFAECAAGVRRGAAVPRAGPATRGRAA